MSFYQVNLLGLMYCDTTVTTVNVTRYKIIKQTLLLVLRVPAFESLM